MKRILSIALLAVLIGPAAHAASVDLGTIGVGDAVGDVQFVSGAGTVVDDDYTFTVADEPGCCNVGIIFDAGDVPPLLSLAEFVVSSAGIVFDYDASDNAYTFFGPLAPGTYVVDVSGVVNGTLAGGYNVLVGATAIPVPAAIWMLGSALALVSLRRRRT